MDFLHFYLHFIWKFIKFYSKNTPNLCRSLSLSHQIFTHFIAIKINIHIKNHQFGWHFYYMIKVFIWKYRENFQYILNYYHFIFHSWFNQYEYDSKHFYCMRWIFTSFKKFIWIELSYFVYLFISLFKSIFYHFFFQFVVYLFRFCSIQFLNWIKKSHHNKQTIYIKLAIDDILMR